MSRDAGTAVTVEAPARLHFGMLDLGGTAGRRFGGIGAALPDPATVVELRRAASLAVTGPCADRAQLFARRFLAAHGIREGAVITVRRAIPPHVGLGSGTQMALAVARGLAELYGLPTGSAELARAVARARRSAIGTFLFGGGGFVLEGGRRVGGHEAAPLLARFEIPRSWRCVLVVPSGPQGMSGAVEELAFERLPPPPEEEAHRVAHLVLMALLPALVEGDLPAFGAALSSIQCLNGRWFAPAQGGAYASPHVAAVVAHLAGSGAVGVGQSSWGPAVYGLVEGDAAAIAIADGARAFLGGSDVVAWSPFSACGAVVTRL